LHKVQTLAAPRRKHVLCEKPLVPNPPMPGRWLQPAYGRRIMGTNHHLRNAATHRKIRELIQPGLSPLFAACSTQSIRLTCRMAPERPLRAAE
jgi:1,5-anhydro-D-fructose reductase (1,5-anhydro-D-mannitol-forming)